MKKITSFLLILIFIFSTFSICQVSAADVKYYTWEDYKYEILKDGTVSIEKYKGYESDVVIPNKINKRKVTRIGDNSFLYNWDLQEVTLPKYLKYVEDDAFSKCYNLKVVTFPPRTVEFGDGVFSDLRNIEKIKISDLKAWCNTSFGSDSSNPMKGGGELYLNGERIENLEIPDGVKTVRKFAFLYGDYEKITIPDSVTKIYKEAFLCSTAKEIIIGNGVEFIGESAFGRCYDLEKLTIGKSVKKIKKEAFNWCRKLESVVLPQGLESIDFNAFYCCTNLADVDIPESVEIVRKGAFDSTLWYNNKPDGMIYINNIAYKYKGKCPEEFALIEGTEYITGYAFNRQKNLKKFTMPNSVVSTGNKIFFNCSNLEKVIFSQNLRSITYEAFRNCYKLENPEIPASVKSIGGYAFLYCTAITSMTIGENVESIGNGVFSRCENLREVTFENNPKKIPDYFFSDCTALEEITLPDSVKTIGKNAFAGCTNFQNLSGGKNVIKYQDNAFEGCSKLSKVRMTRLTKAPTIKRSAFEGTKSGIKFYVKNKTVAKKLKAELQKKSKVKNAKILVGKKVIYKNING